MRTNNNQNDKTKMSAKLIAGVVLLVLIAAAAAVLWTRQTTPPSTRNYEKGAHNQDLSKTDSYKLPGSKPGSGMSFDKPVEYKFALETQNKDQASFGDSLKAPLFAPLGALHAASVSVPIPTTPQILKSINKNLADPKSEAYKAQAESAQKFLATRFSPLYDVTFARGQQMYTPRFKDNAWSFGFSAKPKPSSQTNSNGVPQNATDPAHANALPAGAATNSSASGFEDYKGQVVMIVGKSTYYYFAVYNTNYNWDNNSAIWSKVFNSIRIDQ